MAALKMRLAVLILSSLLCSCTALRHASWQNGLGRRYVDVERGVYVNRQLRRMLQSNASDIAQNIAVNANGFPETYQFHASTDLIGYDLLPANGSCSPNAQLDPAVGRCAQDRQLCCFDASNVQVITSTISNRNRYISRLYKRFAMAASHSRLGMSARHTPSKFEYFCSANAVQEVHQQR